MFIVKILSSTYPSSNEASTPLDNTWQELSAQNAFLDSISKYLLKSNSIFDEANGLNNDSASNYEGPLCPSRQSIVKILSSIIIPSSNKISTQLDNTWQEHSAKNAFLDFIS